MNFEHLFNVGSNSGIIAVYNSGVQHNHYYHGLPNSRNNATGELYDVFLLSDSEDDRQAIRDEKGERVDGTCAWISDNQDFKEWQGGKHSLLCITGSPGKGKTVLSVYLTDTLVNDQRKTTHNMIFFFCRHDKPKLKKSISVLRGLIHQLLRSQPELLGVVETYISGQARRKIPWSPCKLCGKSSSS